MHPLAARACLHTVNLLSIDSLVLDSSFDYIVELSDKLIARGGIPLAAGTAAPVAAGAARSCGSPVGLGHCALRLCNTWLNGKPWLFVVAGYYAPGHIESYIHIHRSL